MAAAAFTKTLNARGTPVWTITGTGQVNLGDAQDGAVGSWVLSTAFSSSGSLTLTKKLRGSSVTDANAPDTFYQNFATGVDASAGVAITGAGLWKVECDGCELVLDITSLTGTLTVEAIPLLG